MGHELDWKESLQGVGHMNGGGDVLPNTRQCVFFVAVFIVRSTENEKTTPMGGGVDTQYTEIVTDDTGDIGR